MRVASLATAGILSVLAPLLISESASFMSELRQASQRSLLGPSVRVLNLILIFLASSSVSVH